MAMTADSEVCTFTQACEDRDFVEWHQGCPWCAVWVVRLDAPSLQARMQQARVALLGSVLARYERQPHVTLAYRGLMAGPTPHAAAAFGVEQLRADVHALQQLQLQPWTLQVQGSGSFTTVPYLGVAQGQLELQQVHALLSPPQPGSDWQYVPHVTLGHYAQRLPLQAVQAHLQQALLGEMPISCAVDALWLARYRTEDIAGALFWEGCYDLRTRRYVAQEGALLHA